MGHPSKSTFRIFIVGSVMLIATALVISVVTGGCFQWVAIAAAIMVLARVAGVHRR